jgi:DNA-binding LacI/PurR family transcriptional regulator
MKKRTTSQQVAERAGVSRTTVSFVLNSVPGVRIPEETRQRVLSAARELNYHPDATARRMVKGKTHVIGFVMRQSAEQVFADLFLPQVLSGITQRARQTGYDILFEIIPPSDPGTGYSRWLDERHVDGIIVSGPRLDDNELTQLYQNGVSIILMGRLPETSLPIVDVDNIGGARQAVQHLISLGHTRIGMITNAAIEYTSSADRLTGYRQALEGANISYDDQCIRHGSFTPESGYAAFKDLFSCSSFPTALFVASDTVAFGVMRACRELGVRIPDDLALVGFDDVPMAELVEPPLTTIRLPAFLLGWEAAGMLVALLEKNETEQSLQTILETELIIRESCGMHKTNSIKS